VKTIPWPKHQSKVNLKAFSKVKAYGARAYTTVTSPGYGRVPYGLDPYGSPQYLFSMAAFYFMGARLYPPSSPNTSRWIVTSSASLRFPEPTTSTSILLDTPSISIYPRETYVSTQLTVTTQLASTVLPRTGIGNVTGTFSALSDRPQATHVGCTIMWITEGYGLDPYGIRGYGSTNIICEL